MSRVIAFPAPARLFPADAGSSAMEISLEMIAAYVRRHAAASRQEAEIIDLAVSRAGRRQARRSVPAGTLASRPSPRTPVHGAAARASLVLVESRPGA